MGKYISALIAIAALTAASTPLASQGLLKKLGDKAKEVKEKIENKGEKSTDSVTDKAPGQEEQPKGPAGSGQQAASGPQAQKAQTTLKPIFTEQSKKIVIPKEGYVFPEIREGMIAIAKYPQMMYVKADSGEYVWGTDFSFTRGNDANSAYFSGGAMMAWRTKPDDYAPSPFIIYPDGKYRDFPTGTKNAVGMPNDIFAASVFVEGYALVQRGNMMSSTQSFIDKDGKNAFPQLTSKQTGTFGDMTVYPLREKRRAYYNAELKKYGYADSNGAIVIKPTFDKALNFSEGLAAVLTADGKWGFIDPTGKMVIPATYRLRPGRFSEGLAAVRIGDNESDYEMAYIDKTGKRVIESKKWNLNEFHGGFALVGTGCEKLYVINDKFEEVRNLTADFYYGGNGFGVCNFSMLSGNVLDKVWGIDFPNGMQSLNQSGVGPGDVFALDGTILYNCVDANGGSVSLHGMTEGDLMFCQVMINNEPRLKEKSVNLPCFINKKGEIVYYFEAGLEGYEGKKPVQVK